MPTTVGSCAVNGVLGSAVAVLGSFQAHMALQLLLGLDPSPLGRLISVDLGTLVFGGFGFLGVEEPAGAPIRFVGREEVAAGDLVVELRGIEEAPEPVQADALRLAPAAIAADPAIVPADRRVVLCCATGVRAHRAARLLEASGARDLAVLALSLG
jgi:rhodanese-related sulfurtransferase